MPEGYFPPFTSPKNTFGSFHKAIEQRSLRAKIAFVQLYGKQNQANQAFCWHKMTRLDWTDYCMAWKLTIKFSPKTRRKKNHRLLVKLSVLLIQWKGLVWTVMPFLFASSSPCLKTRKRKKNSQIRAFFQFFYLPLLHLIVLDFIYICNQPLSKLTPVKFQCQPYNLALFNSIHCHDINASLPGNFFAIHFWTVKKKKKEQPAALTVEVCSSMSPDWGVCLLLCVPCASVSWPPDGTEDFGTHAANKQRRRTFATHSKSDMCDRRPSACVRKTLAALAWAMPLCVYTVVWLLSILFPRRMP